MNNTRATRIVRAAEQRTPDGCATVQELKVWGDLIDVVMEESLSRPLRLRALQQIDRITGQDPLTDADLDMATLDLQMRYQES